MNFDRPKYKTFALMQLKNRWKPAIIATIISVIILTIFSISQQQTNTLTFSQMLSLSYEELLAYSQSNPMYSIPGIILSVIQTIMGFIIEIVLVAFFLIYSRSPDPVSLKQYFEGYNKWARGILCGLWRTLWTCIWGLFLVFLITVYVFIILFTQTSIDNTVLNNTLPVIIIIIGAIPMFIKSIEYSFAMFFTAEFPEIGIRKSLRLSITIAKGHRWDIFVLELSFLGWFLFSAITFGIGFVWTLPYYYMTFINTYHALLQDALESGKIRPEELE